MIRRNIDVIAIALVLAGLALVSSVRDSGISQAIASRRMMMSNHVRDALVRLSIRPPVRYRYY